MPLLPFIRDEFNLDYTRSAFVTSSFSISNAFGQLPAGWLADRVGPRILITVGIFGVAVAGILVGLSQTYIMLLVFLVVMGLLGGGYHPAATPLISMSVEQKMRGRALGFHLIGGNASFFVAPLIAAAIAGAWSWRGSFIGLAVPTAIFGIIFYLFLSRLPGMSGGRGVARRFAEEAPPAPGNVRRLVAFLTMTVLGGGAGMSIIAFISLYIVDKFGASEQTAASMLSIVYSAGLWAGPLGGYLSDRIGRVPVIVATGVFGGIFIYLLKFAPWGLGFGAVLLFMGISNTARLPVAEAFIIDQTTVNNRSMIYGIYYFTMGGTGAVFAPIMGYIIDNWGYDTCFNIAAAASVVVTLACAVFLRGSKR
jgi:FSR family fosmidomycin resistance protein-like MFS transporter